MQNIRNSLREESLQILAALLSRTYCDQSEYDAAINEAIAIAKDFSKRFDDPLSKDLQRIGNASAQSFGHCTAEGCLVYWEIDSDNKQLMAEFSDIHAAASFSKVVNLFLLSLPERIGGGNV